MDISQARTFLSIVDGGNFSAAATRMHVTQSTVSARIKALEGQLGKSLFRRNKSGCELTSAGHKFHRYARSMVRVWEDARLQVALPEGYTEALVIGGQYSLWNRLLLRWVAELRSALPRVAVRGEIGMPDELMRELGEGVLDLAVLYDPTHRPGTRVEELMDDRLVLVTSNPDQALAHNYVFIDWGEEFRAAHSAWFPELHNPGLVLDIGAMALGLILGQGGSGYLPERIALPYLRNQQVYRVKDAPDFSYPAYVVYTEDTLEPRTLTVALETLRACARQAFAEDVPAPEES